MNAISSIANVVIACSLLFLSGCDSNEMYPMMPPQLRGTWVPEGASTATASVEFMAEPGYTFIVRRGATIFKGSFATHRSSGSDPTYLQFHGQEPFWLPGAEAIDPVSYYEFKITFEGDDMLVLSERYTEESLTLRYRRIK